jgi:hypothetical protein
MRLRGLRSGPRCTPPFDPGICGVRVLPLRAGTRRGSPSSHPVRTGSAGGPLFAGPRLLATSALERRPRRAVGLNIARSAGTVGWRSPAGRLGLKAEAFCVPRQHPPGDQRPNGCRDVRVREPGSRGHLRCGRRPWREQDGSYDDLLAAGEAELKKRQKRASEDVLFVLAMLGSDHSRFSQREHALDADGAGVSFCEGPTRSCHVNLKSAATSPPFNG